MKVWPLNLALKASSAFTREKLYLGLGSARRSTRSPTRAPRRLTGSEPSRRPASPSTRPASHAHGRRPHGLGVTLPDNAIVLGGGLEILTTFTSHRRRRRQGHHRAAHPGRERPHHRDRHRVGDLLGRSGLEGHRPGRAGPVASRLPIKLRPQRAKSPPPSASAPSPAASSSAGCSTSSATERGERMTPYIVQPGREVRAGRPYKSAEVFPRRQGGARDLEADAALIAWQDAPVREPRAKPMSAVSARGRQAVSRRRRTNDGAASEAVRILEKAKAQAPPGRTPSVRR